MDPALLGAMIGGTIAIVAAIIGQIANQIFRRYGKVRCFVPHSSRLAPQPSASNPDIKVIKVAFPLGFFNEKEVAIGITELMFTFHKGGEQLAMAFIKEKDSEGPIRTLDLPPRQWVHKEIEFEASIFQVIMEPPREGAPELREEMLLTWTYPTGKKETRVIPTHGHDERRFHQARVRRAARRSLDVF